MKTLFISFLALTFLMTSCGDSDSTVLEETPILVGSWIGHWIDDLDTEIELRIWQDSDTEEMILEFAPIYRDLVMEMISDIEFKIAQHQDGDELVRYHSEFVEEVLYLTRYTIPGNIEDSREAHLRKVK